MKPKCLTLYNFLITPTSRSCIEPPRVLLTILPTHLETRARLTQSHARLFDLLVQRLRPLFRISRRSLAELVLFRRLSRTGFVFGRRFVQRLVDDPLHLAFVRTCCDSGSDVSSA